MQQQPGKQHPHERRLLIVDDLTGIRKVLLAYLADLGYSNFVEVTDGKRAFDLLREERFDLIISDVEVPGLNGRDLLERLRADADLKTLPFLLLTSCAHDRAPGDGCSTAFISKPFSKEDLEQTLRRLTV